MLGALQRCPPKPTDLSKWFDKFVAAPKDSGSVAWWTVFLQSWAPSTLDVYERHLQNLRQRSMLPGARPPTQVLQDYLLELYRTQLTSSDMH